MDALDGIGSRLCHHDPGARRSGKADHINVGMRRNRGTNNRSFALHQIEHTSGNARCVHDFGEDRGTAGAFFGWLQDHCIATRKRGRDFQGNLVQRPVPRRDHADNADGFIHRQPAADLFAELKILERGNRAHKGANPRADLRGLRKAHRRAHFGRHRARQIGNALFIFGDDVFHQRNALFAAGLRPGFERGLCSGNRGIDIGHRAQHDFGADFLGRRADHFVARAADAVDPCAVDVVFQIAVHESLRSRCMMMSMWCCRSMIQVCNCMLYIQLSRNCRSYGPSRDKRVIRIAARLA